MNNIFGEKLNFTSVWSEDLLDPLNVNGSVLVDLYFIDTPDVPYKVVNIIIILRVQIFLQELVLSLWEKNVGVVQKNQGQGKPLDQYCGNGLDIFPGLKNYVTLRSSYSLPIPIMFLTRCVRTWVSPSEGSCLQLEVAGLTVPSAQ